MNYDEKLKSTRPLAVPFWERLAPMKWFTFVIVTLINLGGLWHLENSFKKTSKNVSSFQKLLKTSANPKTAKKKKKAAEKAVAGETVPQLVEQ